MIKTLIVDDEQLAREELKYLLSEHRDFEVIAECSNAIEAVKAINTLKPDIAFLDIKMPKISGIELAGMLDEENMPRIVFVTAYDEYAIEAFENNAIDYLIKPLDEMRFEQTLERLRIDQQPQELLNEILPDKLMFIPCYKGTQNYLINYEEIEFAHSNPITGVHLKTADGEYHTSLTLKTLEEKTSLLRCHRQYLVQQKSVKIISKLENGLGEALTYSGNSIPISRRHLSEM